MEVMKVKVSALQERQVDVVEVWDVERERMRGSGDRRLFVPLPPIPVPRGKSLDLLTSPASAVVPLGRYLLGGGIKRRLFISGVEVGRRYPAAAPTEAR
jgi:hypothetical protein